MGRSLNNRCSSLLANPAVVSAVFQDGGTGRNANVTEDPSQTATITRNKAETSIL